MQLINIVLISFLFFASNAFAKHCFLIKDFLTREKRLVAHDAITEDLFVGKTIRAEAFSADGNKNQLYKVAVKNEANGQVREALWKPRPFGDGDGWNRVSMEYVGYRINLMLRMDFVPPVSYRRNFDVAFKTWAEGALLYMVPDAQGLKKVARNQFCCLEKELFLSDTRIFDYIMKNGDRHVDNFLWGKHWVDGSSTPVLIDSAAGFREATEVTLKGVDVFGYSLNTVRRSTYDALKKIDFATVKDEIGEFATDSEIRAMLKRRDDILGHFNRLISQNGYQKVVLD